MIKNFHSDSLSDTDVIAGEILSEFPARIYALIGDLGSGKTTLAKSLLYRAGVKDEVTSPTFIIFKKYPVGDRIYLHMDCYRLESLEELKPLHFKKELADPKNICIIEWADKIEEILPKDRVEIRCTPGPHPDSRIFTVIQLP
ncbi:MAG: tRNA (adenosine(37)-N6)-threonylcarbamoyltransferase complex ATPase subunit type 1 TsaE [Candidatus Harrisonbacteria bacterium]|nr:tRNA (adenosine(37)-N6)-threonylcarbamoyltransferase complex ATPase subunit type 1 TsaE [Candidatus Harrisonbacteria bacterium]